MAKKNIGTQAFPLPMPMTILGTHLDGKPNFMALGWVSRVNFKPPLLAVGVNRSNQSCRAILESGGFSVNIPSVEMKDLTDYVGLVSAKRTDKSGLFEIFYGELPAAPMIDQCPLAMECKLVQSVALATNVLFIGEIRGAYCDEDMLDGDAPDLEKIQPFLLSMPDNQFWAVGEKLGRAWHDGKKLKK